MEHPSAPEMSGGLADTTMASRTVENQVAEPWEDHVASAVQAKKPADDGALESHGAAKIETATSEFGSVISEGEAIEPVLSDAKSRTERRQSSDPDGETVEPWKRRKQRRQSFFVIPDSQGRGNANKLLERIEIDPLQRSSTFEIGKPKKRQPRNLDRSSLEAVLRHAVNGPVVGCVEAQIPVPESRDGYISDVSETAILSDDKSKSSLEVITQHGVFPEGPNAWPATLPLPDSPAESIRETNDNELYEEPQQKDQPSLPIPDMPPPPPPPLKKRRLRVFNYEHIRQLAAENFEHLKYGKIHAYSRHNNMSINLVDIFESGTSKSILVDDPQGDLALRQVLRDIPSGTKQRLLVVEDISARTIDFLGSLYGINPEFFEEHLINSGYEGPKYDDPPAQTWTTSELKKSYASMKWYRPVWRLDVVPYSNRDLDDLLDPKLSRLEYISTDSNNLVVYETETNIFRSEWRLWTDPKTTTRTRRVCGWEERVSIWSQKLPGRDCHIIILLLDPLPTLSEGIERVVTATRRVVHSDGSSLASDSSVGHDNGPAASHHTIDAEEMERIAQHLKARNVGKKPPSRLDKFLQSLWLRAASKKNDDTASQLSQTYEIIKTKQFQKKRSRAIFEQVASRARVDVDLERAFQFPPDMTKLRGDLYTTSSTKEIFNQLLGFSGDNKVIDGPFGVMTPLFHILKKDTTSLLKILHRTLDNINSEILDDTKMEDRLTLWRQLIIRAQDELPELKRSIKAFFLRQDYQASANAEDRMDSIKELQELLNQIDDMRQKLSIASASLTSNMALLESKRSIAEAQSVTKLTELAFFFIPLTFAATIFGMQIDQFENRAPLSTFIIVGIAFTVFSYLIRLVIRSMWIRHLKEACGESIKLYADHKRQPVQRGYVPASLFIRWMGHELKLAIEIAASRSWNWITATTTSLLKSTISFIISLLMVSAIAVGPIAVLWTRDMNHGTQAIITVVVLIAVLILVIVVPGWLNAESSSRSALHGALLKTFHVKDALVRLPFTHPTVFKVIIWVGLTAMAVVPLALIWTRPVAPGIKAAVTVTIVLVVVLGFISFGLYKLISAARDISSSTGSLSMSDD